MTSGIAQSLKTEYLEGSERLQLEFEKTRSGRSVLQGRTALVDSLCHQLWRHHINPDLSLPEGFTLVAIGGYGRGVLAPYSDIDLLFLSDGEAPAASRKDANPRLLSGSLGSAAQGQSHYAYSGELRPPASRQSGVQYFAARLPRACRRLRSLSPSARSGHPALGPARLAGTRACCWPRSMRSGTGRPATPSSISSLTSRMRPADCATITFPPGWRC